MNSLEVLNFNTNEGTKLDNNLKVNDQNNIFFT